MLCAIRLRPPEQESLYIIHVFQTFKREFKYCDRDSELWRMRYNYFRPHVSLNNKTPDEIYNDFRLLF